MVRRCDILFALLSTAAFVRADSIWTGASTGAPLIKDVRISGISGEKLLFDVRGNSSSRDLPKVSRIAVDNEPAMTAGEDAFAVDQFDNAIVNYTKVVRSSMAAGANKLWLADWASRRLLVIADKTGRFDAGVTAYVARVQFDAPATVQRPALPESQSTYLNTAADEINAALANAKLNDDQRTALLTFLVDVHRARRDAKSADAAAEKLDEVLAKDPTNPNAARAIARRKLQQAQAAADRKDWRGAFSAIDSNRALFTETSQQADALYLLAECRFQIAMSPEAATASPDARAQACREAALAFVRVIANFKDQPQRPHLAASLFRVGQLEEAVGDARGAMAAYEQLAAQFPDDPSTAEARQRLANLRTVVSTTAPATRPADRTVDRAGDRTADRPAGQ